MQHQALGRALIGPKYERFMLATTQAVVLRVIEHGDSSVILRAWTRHGGMRSYIARTGKKKGAMWAALQALTRIELVADDNADRELHVVRELRVSKPFIAIPFDPLRGAVAIFVQEVLNKVLRVEGPDAGLDAFIHESLESLDTSEDLRWFPQVFLLQLSGHLGFFPDRPRSAQDHFDLEEGCFIASAPRHGHALAPPFSTVLGQLLDVEVGALTELDARSDVRRLLLDHLLLYYRLHIDGLGTWRSPEVLRATLA